MVNVLKKAQEVVVEMGREDGCDVDGGVVGSVLVLDGEYNSFCFIPLVSVSIECILGE